ncbi:hypothetical protein PO883_09415 [Massilia sp. DJPM01]|uniref:hypothetical protein n=1 Tax=Massilia sp. DJPM01 TaxID=3024404 RepID=UPI00259D3EF4|nr:hypothetical protein [Massilia sp. DJPM01]MDM5177407.1 hypothetical protein [Massilia sp. DJPM01]
METSDVMRQKLIDEVLAASPDGECAARAAALNAWERLMTHLTPLIGEAALCAMYARARHLTFPDSLPSPVLRELRSAALLLDQLGTQLGAMEPQAADAFHRAMLESYTRLLAGLIGEALTVRLMNTAWTERSGGKST